MNGEIGNFFVTFTTNGIQDLKDGLKDIDTKMEGLSKTFNTGMSSGDKFFNKFTAWTGKLATLTAGFIGIAKAMKDAFNIGKDITQLNVLADVAGVKAEQVEALAIALAPLKGGQKDIASAANFYRNMLETQTSWWRGQYGEQVIEEMSRAGVRGIKADSTPEQFMNGLIDALSFYQNQNTRQAIGARNLFAKAFGLTDEQMLLFASGRDFVNSQLAYGMQHLSLSGEANLQKAMEQTKAKMEFKEEWDKFVEQLNPLTTDFLNALTWMVSGLRAVAQWIQDKLGVPYEYVKDVIKGDISSTDATLKLTEGLQDIATDEKQPRWKRKISEAFGALSKLVTDEVARRNGKTEADLIDEANTRLTAIGKSPLNTAGTTNTATVNVETININGTSTDAAIKTKDALQTELGKLQFQPATLTGGSV